MPDLVKLDFPDTDLFILKSGDWQGFRSNACKKEPETVEWIRSIPEGSYFFDIGASVGSYSLIAHSRGLRVFSFEPHPPTYGELIQNLWLNGFPGDDAFPVALAANENFYWGFFTCWPSPGSASHAGSAPAGDGERQALVPYVALDYFEETASVPAMYVKIDVDGGELDVINGMQESLIHTKSMMIESEPGVIEDIAVVLASCGLTQTKSWPRMGETKQKNYLFERDA